MITPLPNLPAVLAAPPALAKSVAEFNRSTNEQTADPAFSARAAAQRLLAGQLSPEDAPAERDATLADAVAAYRAIQQKRQIMTNVRNLARAKLEEFAQQRDALAEKLQRDRALALARQRDPEYGGPTVKALPKGARPAHETGHPGTDPELARLNAAALAADAARKSWGEVTEDERETETQARRIVESYFGCTA